MDRNVIFVDSAATKTERTVSRSVYRSVPENKKNWMLDTRPTTVPAKQKIIKNHSIPCSVVKDFVVLNSIQSAKRNYYPLKRMNAGDHNMIIYTYRRRFYYYEPFF